MQAILCRNYGPPDTLVIGEAERPRPAAGQALVRVAAVGLSFPDLLSVAGTYPIPSDPPFVPGVEGAGEIVDPGGSDRLRPGDRVCWQDNDGKAAWATHAAIAHDRLAPIPDALDTVQAAAMPMNYGTAGFALFHRAGLAAGDVVVVHGASGGVGQAAMQLAREAGARVVATTGSPGKVDRLRAEGADHVLVTDAPDLRAALEAATGSRRADIVVDPVGGALFEASLRLLAPYGRLLTIGFTSGDFGSVPSNILLVKGVSVIGANYGHYLATEPDAAREALSAMLDRAARGALRVRPEIAEGLPALPGALARLAARAAPGKIVVRL